MNSCGKFCEQQSNVPSEDPQQATDQNEGENKPCQPNGDSSLQCNENKLDSDNG